MRIYRMTATFGKLERQTLALEPGLNVIEAPNEWGKSTWCAFLMAMFYGLDTRAKTTKTALADKERYAPWSGSPMAGRIDLNWNGRDITIERSTKGRTPLGVFRAYETESGLAVPELTAANCGQMILGVEQSVYRRTGFIRQSDLPVTQDDALRRRLNALVTTGDESGDSDYLAAELKDLKNKCRYNRSGLLPQAEARKRELEEKKAELDSLQIHARKMKERLGEVKSWRLALENHADTLRYAAAEADAFRVAEARDLRDQAEAAMAELERRCARQSTREEITARVQAIQDYRRKAESCRMEELRAGSPPSAPVPPEVFRGMPLHQAEEMVRQDLLRHKQLSRQQSRGVLLPGVVCLLAAAVLLAMQKWWAGLLLIPALALLSLGLVQNSRGHREREGLESRYGRLDPNQWKALLENHRASLTAYEQARIEYQEIRHRLDGRRAALLKQQHDLFGNRDPEEVLEECRSMEKNWAAYDGACQSFRQAEKHLAMLQEMAQSHLRRPAQEDALTYSEAETQRLLEEAQAEQQRLQNRLGQYQGRMEALGEAGALEEALHRVQLRIEKLEEIYEAASLALETLARARQELQRRFAPRISSRAQALLGEMTAGRYERLTLDQDLTILAGAAQEETLREILWRSEGTADQLYLALRLAVAEELTPQTPLVLDDAFVRFDDVRLKAALEILKQISRQKQVILFTCQHRENAMLQ